MIGHAKEKDEGKGDGDLDMGDLCHTPHKRKSDSKANFFHFTPFFPHDWTSLELDRTAGLYREGIGQVIHPILNIL
jgi:hypothetical protein